MTLWVFWDLKNIDIYFSHFYTASNRWMCYRKCTCTCVHACEERPKVLIPISLTMSQCEVGSQCISKNSGYGQKCKMLWLFRAMLQIPWELRQEKLWGCSELCWQKAGWSMQGVQKGITSTHNVYQHVSYERCSSGRIWSQVTSFPKYFLSYLSQLSPRIFWWLIVCLFVFVWNKSYMTGIMTWAAKMLQGMV